MYYVIALFVPPLGVLLAGRPILAGLVCLVWLPAVILTGGMIEPAFIVLAWILIWRTEEARERRPHGD